MNKSLKENCNNLKFHIFIIETSKELIKPLVFMLIKAMPWLQRKSI